LDFKEVLYDLNPRLYHPTTVQEKHRIIENMKKIYIRDKKRHEYLKYETNL